MSLEIVEKKNKKVLMKPVKMNTNQPIPNGVPPFEKYNFALLVCGAPASGKTSLVISQLTNSGGMFYKKFHKVVIFSPSLATIDKKIKLPEEQIHSVFDINILEQLMEEQKAKMESDEEPHQALVVLDDMMSDLSMKQNLPIFSKMVNNRRHYRLSIICITQIYNKIKPSVRKSFSDVILFKTTNRKEIATVFEELTGYDIKEIRAITKYSFEEPHSFLMFRNNGTLFKNFNELHIKVIEDDSEDSKDLPEPKP